MARDADRAAQHADQSAADCQAQARSAEAARRGRVGLLERLEQPPDLLVRHPDAGITDRDAQGPVAPPHLDPDFARLRELDGVADQIEQHLTQAGRVGADASGYVGFDADRQLEPLGHGPPRRHCLDVGQYGGRVGGDALDGHLVGLDLRQVQHVIDQAQQVLAVAGDRLDATGPFVVGHTRVAQQVREAQDRRHRRADLMTHVRQERAFGPAGLLGGGLGGLGLGGLDGQLGAAAFEFFLDVEQPLRVGVQVVLAALAGGDVLHLGDLQFRHTDRVDDHAHVSLSPERRAVTPDVTLLDRVMLSLAGQHAADQGEVLLDVIRVREPDNFHGQQLGFGVAEHRAELGVDVHQGAVEPGDGHADRAALERAADHLGRLVQSPIALPLRVDVLRQPDHPPDAAVGTAREHPAAEEKPPVRARSGPQTHFDG